MVQIIPVLFHQPPCLVYNVSSLEYLIPLSAKSSSILLFKYDLDRSTTHPEFNQTGVRTHDLQIMTAYFMSLQMSILATLLLETLIRYLHFGPQDMV